MKSVNVVFVYEDKELSTLYAAKAVSVVIKLQRHIFNVFQLP